MNLRILATMVSTAILLTTPAVSAPPGQTLENDPNKPQIVKLYSSGTRVLAMLTLGENAPAPVVFDTGEDNAILVSSYAKGLELKIEGSTTLVDEATGKRSQVPVVALPKPQLGGVALSLLQAKRVDFNEPDMVGVFGPGAFKGRLVTLELARNRVRIAPLSSESLPPGKPSPYFHHLPAIVIDVAGIPAIAHLDSGSTLGLGLGRALMSKVRLKSSPVVVGQAVSISGAQDVYAAQIDGDVRIGPVVLHDPEVTFAGDGEGANVGYDIMRQLTIVMDPEGQRSWVLDPSDIAGSLDPFAGKFGVRSIRVANGKLIYQRDGRPSFAMKYLGGDLFEIPQTGDRVQFHRKGGRVVSLELITADGEVVSTSRTS